LDNLPLEVAVAVDVERFLDWIVGGSTSIVGSTGNFCGDRPTFVVLLLAGDEVVCLTAVDCLLDGVVVTETDLEVSFLEVALGFLDGEEDPDEEGFFSTDFVSIVVVVDDFLLLLFPFLGSRDEWGRSLVDESESEDDDELLDTTLTEDFADLSRKGDSLVFCLSPAADIDGLLAGGGGGALLFLSFFSLSLSLSEDDPDDELALLLEVLELERSTATDFLRSIGFFVALELVEVVAGEEIGVILVSTTEVEAGADVPRPLICSAAFLAACLWGT
jgi:hypothetical protein